MKLEIQMRLEVRGDSGALTNFQRIDWSKEAQGSGIGLLSNISNQRQLEQDWCSLGRSGAEGTPVITWHSMKYPNYIDEVAEALPNLTLIVSEYWSDNSIVGTRVFGAGRNGGSWEGNPEPLEAFVDVKKLSCTDKMLRTRIINDVCNKHYEAALKASGLELVKPVLF